MTQYEIPLSPQPQTLAIVLAGVKYSLRLLWNNFAQSWTLDISTAQGLGIITGIPLVTGCNLLSPFAYLQLGGGLYCYSDFDITVPPAFTNLGETSHLIFVTTP